MTCLGAPAAAKGPAVTRKLLIVPLLVLLSLALLAPSSALAKNQIEVGFSTNLHNYSRQGVQEPRSSYIDVFCGYVENEAGPELCSQRFEDQGSLSATVERNGAIVGSAAEDAVPTDPHYADILIPIAPEAGDLVRVSQHGQPLTAVTYGGGPTVELNCAVPDDPGVPFLEGEKEFGSFASGSLPGEVQSTRYRTEASYVVQPDGYWDVRAEREVSPGVNVTSGTGVPITNCAAAEAPVAGCDQYWTPPGQTLSIAAPGVLANDGDPKGLPITAKVLKVSFGVKEHPYSLDPATGALTFKPGSQKGPRKATITYEVVNSKGTVSPPTTATIFVQDERPSLKQCAEAKFDSSKPDPYQKVCSDISISGSEKIDRDGAKGTLEWGFVSRNKESLCHYFWGEWALEGRTFVRWKGTPDAQVSVAETATTKGSKVQFDPSVGVGFDGPVPSVGASVGISVQKTANSVTLASVPEKNSAVIDSRGAPLVAKTNSTSFELTATASIAVGKTTLRLRDPSRTAHVCLLPESGGVPPKIFHGAKAC
jgi:hypothetical protein